MRYLIAPILQNSPDRRQNVAGIRELCAIYPMKKTFFLTTIFLTCKICSAQNFLNGSLENWASATTCENNIPPDNWTDYSTGGLGPDEVNFSVCPTTFPSSASSGIVYSRMYSGSDSTGEGMFQNISGFVIGNTYQITFDFAGCSYLGGTGQIQFHLFIDDIDVNQTVVFNSNTPTWTTNTFNFIASQSLHKIGVQLFRLSGSASGAIDNFNLSNITGIENFLPQSQIQCFPNPFNEMLSVKINGNSTCVFSVFDTNGKIIYTNSLTRTTIIKTEEFVSGIYFYLLSDEHGNIQRGKLVKLDN